MAAKVNREANLRGGCGAAAAACEIFLVPGQTWQASLMASIEARKFSWYPARLRRRPQTPRPLGNLQTTCLSFSDSSGRLRGGRQQRFSGTRPDFAGGRSRPDPSEGGTNIHDKVFPAHPAYLCRRLSGIGMRCERSDTMSDYYLLLRDYSNYYL